jgi:hypothetical protein
MEPIRLIPDRQLMHDRAARDVVVIMMIAVIEHLDTTVVLNPVLCPRNGGPP